MAQRHRLAILTAPSPTEREEIFVRRLADSPSFEVVAIVLDDSLRARSPADVRSALAAGPVVDRAMEALWALWERDHPPHQPEPAFGAVADRGARIEHVTDVHSWQGAALLRSARPDLLVSCSRPLFDRDLVATARHGAVSLQKRKPPEHFGSGPVGYWELVDGEDEIVMTVHLSEPGDGWGRGRLLGRRAIPIQPYDTLRSLDIRAGIAGFELTLQALESFAAGRAADFEPARPCGFVRAPPGQLAVARLERVREEHQRIAHDRHGSADEYDRKATTWLKYLLAYPLLRQKKRQLVANGQAPIITLFYDRVANDAGNPGTLPLEKFVDQIELIRRYHPILPLEEACHRLERGHNDEVAFVLTFDDGYAADSETSIPYLRWHGIPATFFVSIGNIVEGRLFEHDLERGIGNCPPMTVEQLRALDRSGILKRAGHPFEPIHLIKLMDGYTGISDLGRNNLWDYRLSAQREISR